MGRQHIQLLCAKEKQSWCAPYLTSSERIHQVPKTVKNRDVEIIYQASLFGKIITRESRKVLDILKEPTLVTDSKTWIKGIKCG